MNAHDALLWTSGREKVDAGIALTDDERDVLLYFGGETALRRRMAVRAVPIRNHIRPAPGMKQRQVVHRADLAGKLHTTSLEGKVQFSSIEGKLKFS